MKTITCYLDFISPYAYLAFEALPRTLMGLSHQVVYKPVLFAGLLKHHGQLGPAEIAGKRDWTYRQVLWQARAHGIALDLPQAHPFNPLALLRLALACEADAPATGSISRWVAERVFHHVWRGGAAADDAQRCAELTAAMTPAHSPDAPEVKAALKANTDEAIALGLFGVPSFVVDGQVFWGLDALPLLRAFLDGDQFFDGPWQQAARVTQGVRR